MRRILDMWSVGGQPEACVASRKSRELVTKVSASERVIQHHGSTWDCYGGVLDACENEGVSRLVRNVDP
jgi:hypothetical protein